MSRGARRWAAAAALLLTAGGALAFGQVTGTFAVFNAVSENQNNVLVGGWVPEPSGTGSAVGSSPYTTASLSWTPGAGTNPPESGQTLKYHDGGSGASASCPSPGDPTYSSVSSPGLGVNSASVTGANFTDWWCYEINSVDGNWTTDYVAFPAVRLLVPVSVAASGNGNGNLDNGDSIVITFNQNVSLSGGPTGICTDATNNAIAIGITSCAAGTQGTVGTITGLGFVKKTGAITATITAAGNQITVGVTSNSRNVTVGAGATFTAGPADIASTGGWTACTAAACQPTPSGSF